MKRITEYAAGVGRKRVAQNILRLGANVADGETITIGRDVFEMDTNAATTAGNIAVNVSGNLTPTLAGPLIVAAINNSNTQKLVAVQIAVGVIGVYSNEPNQGHAAVPCAEAAPLPIQVPRARTTTTPATARASAAEPLACHRA